MAAERVSRSESAPEPADSPRRGERWTWIALVATGLLSLALFPPFSIADEPAHFYRAFAISEGRLLPASESGRSGSWLPASLPELVEVCLTGFVREPDQRFGALRWNAAWSVELLAHERRFVEHPASAMLPFLPYLPQAAGIAVGRVVGLPPVGLLYLGRVANLVAACWLVSLALRWIPVLRWPLLLLAASPAASSARASLSPDAATFALALLSIAWIVRRLVVDRDLPLVHPVSEIACGVALCLTKLPYAVLLVAAFPRLRMPRPPRRRALLAVSLLLTALAFSIWSLGRVRQPLRDDVRVDRSAQLQRVLEDPGHFTGAAFRTLRNQGPRLVADLWGARLGWLDARVPAVVPWSLGLLFLILIVLDRPDRGSPQPRGPRWLRPADALAFGIAILGSVTAIVLSQYVTWTPPGDPVVRGLQGRYFLPVVPFVAVLLASVAHRIPLPVGARRPSGFAATWTLAGILATSLVVGVALLRRYWIP